VALYSTNYPIFHTGSHGTLIFTLTKDSMFVDTYDYMSKIHQAATIPSRQRQKQQKREYVELEKTTPRVFQRLEEHSRLIVALKSEGAVMGYCPPISLDLYLERYEIIKPAIKVELIKLLGVNSNDIL